MKLVLLGVAVLAVVWIASCVALYDLREEFDRHGFTPEERRREILGGLAGALLLGAIALVIIWLS